MAINNLFTVLAVCSFSIMQSEDISTVRLLTEMNVIFSAPFPLGKIALHNVPDGPGVYEIGNMVADDTSGA